MAVIPKLLGTCNNVSAFRKMNCGGSIFTNHICDSIFAHNGYVYEFFPNYVTIYKIVENDAGAIVDLVDARNVSITNKASNILFFKDGHVIKFVFTCGGTMATTTSGATSVSTAGVSLTIYLYKLNGTNITETVINSGNIINVATDALSTTTYTYGSSCSNTRVAILCDNDLNFRIFALALAATKYTFNVQTGPSGTTTQQVSASSNLNGTSVAAFNIDDVVATDDPSSMISFSKYTSSSESGSAHSMFISDFDTFYRYCSYTNTSGSTVTGYSKFTVSGNTAVSDGNSYKSNTMKYPYGNSLSVADTGNTHDIDVMCYYKDINTIAIHNFTSENQVDSASAVQIRPFVHSSVYITSVTSGIDSDFPVRNKQIYGLPFYNNGKLIQKTSSYSTMSLSTSSISSSAIKMMDNVGYIGTVNYANNTLRIVDKGQNTPRGFLLHGNMFSYNNRVYSRMLHYSDYAGMVLSSIKYGTDTDRFYLDLDSFEPVIVASDKIIEVVSIRSSYFASNTKSDICNVLVMISDDDTVNHTILYDSIKSEYDFSSHPIILNPGQKLYILTSDFEDMHNIEFSVFGCEVS